MGWLTLFMPMLLPWPALAQELNVDIEAAVHLKVLSYERKLGQRSSGGKLVIAVLYRPGVSKSERARVEMLDAFRRVGAKVTVQNMKVNAVAIAYEPGSLVAQLRQAEANAVYVTHGLEDVIPSLVETALKLKVPTLCRDRAAVAQGLTIGVVNNGARSAIVVNLRAVRALDLDLDARVLRLAEVLK